MQSEHLNIQMGQLLDQTSNAKIKVQNGHFVVHNLETGSVQRYLLPPLKFKDQKIAFGQPLKFVSKSSNVQLNPTGNILICKSLTFQQVQMSQIYNKEITYWSLYLPHRCSSFSVGIKSSELKKSYTFDFSINKSTLLTFKLDLEEKIFTCWLNGVRSEWHKAISIENDSQWTPFVRVKNIGTQLILNSLVSDPQTPFVSYLNSHKKNTVAEYAQPEIQSPEEGLQRNKQTYHLQKMTNNKIILIGQSHIKLISRQENEKQFNLQFAQFTKDNKITVPLSEREFQTINKFSKKCQCSLLSKAKLSKNTTDQGYFISVNSHEWRQQMTEILRTLTMIKQASYESTKGAEVKSFKDISIEEVDNVARIFLSKVQMVNPYLSGSQRINSLFSQFNVKFNNIEPLPFFDQIQTSFNVPKTLALNNYPFLKFNSPIVSVKTADETFIACLLKDGNRVSIVNTSSIPFKLIDTIISRGFIKETEINQYKKQVEDINDSDFTKPHIFKILKNCLKYADKIKPPEKLLKELQKKKQEIQVKKSTVKEQKPLTSNVQADKELLSSLISMGFNEKLSTKVLIECKNQSIEAALELILSKYPHENEQPTSKGESKNKPKRQWQCQICTLINSKDFATCSACDSPAPAQSAFEQIEMLESKIQQKEIQQKQQGEKEIFSSTIDNQAIRDIFVWNTKVAYCPLLIAAVFETKVRFRLLGPNPKFYSNFYVKDNGFFDLTTLKYHEFAHQIDQSQINDMFFLSSSTQEQRKMNWGWMNIEDWDYDISNNKNVTSIDFKSTKITNKLHKFLINVNTEKTSNTLNCQILFDNVYEQKKRCFIVKDVNVSESQRKPLGENQNVLEKKLNFVDESKMTVSSNSNVVCDFVKNVSVREQNPTVKQSLASDNVPSQPVLAPTKSDLIPLIAIAGPYSSTLSYPSCQLQPLSSEIFNLVNEYKNGLVFRHPQNKKFTVKCVKLQRQNSATSNGIQKMGYFYVINDLSKEPLVKHEFGFKVQESKAIVNLQNNSKRHQGSYVVVVLHPATNSETSRELLTSVQIYGQLQSISNNQTSSIDVTEYISNKLTITLIKNDQKQQQSQWKQLFNIKCELINYPYDLSSQQSAIIKRLIQQKNSPINLRLTIEAKGHIQQQKNNETITNISSVQLNTFTLIKSQSIFTNTKPQHISQEQYKNNLIQFFTPFSENPKCFDIITKEENKKLYKHIVEQIDLKQLIEKIVQSQYRGKKFVMLKQFINMFAIELAKNKTLISTNEKAIIKNALKSSKLTPAGAEILFQMIKLTKCVNFQMLENELHQHLLAIAQKKKKLNSTMTITKHMSQSYHKEKTMFSPLLYKLGQNSNSNKSMNITTTQNILQQQSLPMYHFTCLKHPHGRKYVIDMMSLYKVQEIELRLIDSVRDKERLVVEVVFLDERGLEHVVEKRFIDEFQWSQLVIGPSSGSGKGYHNNNRPVKESSIFLNLTNKNTNQQLITTTTRYIVINLTFTTIPSHTSISSSSSSALSSSSSSSSTLQILPIIHGQYIGQSQPLMQQHFEQLTQSMTSVYDNKLQRIKKVDNFVKYGHKQDQKLFYYTSCEDDVLMGVNNSDNNHLLQAGGQNKKLSQLRQREQTQENKSVIIKELLKSPSHANLNYHFTMGYLLINSIIDTLSQQHSKQPNKNTKTTQLIIQHFVNNERGPLVQKSIQLLRKFIARNNIEVIKQLLGAKILTQHVFNAIFKDLKIDQNECVVDLIKQLISDVDNLKSNKSLSVNLSWLAKLYTLDKNIIQTLVKAQYQSGHLQQTAIVFTKYGWAQSTVHILNSLISQQKTDRLPAIISASKNNKQLSQFAFQQLKSSNEQIFSIVMGQLALKSRHTKITQIQNIVFYIIENIKSPQQQQDDYQKRQKYLSVLAMVNKFGYTNDIAEQVIKIFFILQEKNAYLNELLNCTFMKEKKIVQKLLTVTLVELKLTKALKRDDFMLLNDILGFVLSKEVNLQTQQISFTLENDTQKILLQFFSTYLLNSLAIGGLESAKMTDQLLTQKIKIAFYLSTLLQSTQVFKQIDEEIFGSLIKWLLMNITVNDEKHPKTPNCNRFLKIEQTVWKIVEHKGRSQGQLFAKLYMEIYKKTKQQILLVINPTLRYQSLRKLYAFNIKVLEKFADVKEFLERLNLNNGLFEEILEEFAKLDVKNMRLLSQAQNEQQLVNELTLHPDQKQKPTDWLMYKNGSKNHIYKLQYFKNTQQQIELTLMHDEEFTLSKVVFAFKLQSANEKNICLPKSITVEGGLGLDKLRYLGEMFEVKDDRYYNLSTKIYGLNMNILKERLALQKQLNKNLPVKYLRFKIRAPEPISIEDVLEGAQFMEGENKVSLVNFLSIQGEKAKHAQPSINELVKLLELLTLPEHRQLINKLFNVTAITQKFKLSLTTFSQLMKHEKYNKIIHNFLMRVCQQNTLIGNEMLTKYLNVQNAQICAKIATEIVLANDQQLKNRVILMYEFVERVINNEKKTTFDENVLPFMNRFAQVAYYTMTRQNYTQKDTLTEISLTVSQKTVEKLLLLLEDNTESSQIVSKFISTILTLNKPFITSGFTLTQILSKIAQRKNVQFDQLLSALVINSQQCRRWFMSNQMLEKMFDETFAMIKESNDVAQIVRNMALFTTLSLNPSIKQLINKYQYNLRLFELLMGKSTQAILSASQNQQLRKSFVELIARTSLGSENQAIIGQLLKDSIPSIISQGNEKFVGEIFLPLLNSFQKVPVCVLPYVENENKLITDLSNVDFRNDKSEKSKAKQNQQDISGFRLPSSLVSEEIKQKIFDELIKNSYQNGKFNLALNHGNYTEGLGQSIINNVFYSNRPFMTIIKLKSKKDPSQTRTICIFYNRSKDTQNENKLKLNWTAGTFMIFIDHPNKSNNNTQNIITISKQPKKNTPLLDFHHFELNTNQSYDKQGDEYQSIVFEYGDNIFGQIGYGGCYTNIFHFDDIKIFGEDNEYIAWQPESVEFWLLYSSLQSANEKAIQVQQKSTLPQLTKSLLQTNYDHTLFSNIHKASNTLNTLRYETVYEFPASLTVRQLKESMRIINCSIDDKKLKDLKLTIKGNQLSSAITDDLTLEEIRKLSKTKQTIVLDLNVHVDNLLDVLNLKSPYKRQEVDFLPRKGILKYFEENQGIQAMIKVIKKSIQGWKNKVRMEKWLQYVIELENFSHFPHFFAIYLKDRQTFNLLFNLLAGLPDRQTDTKWDTLQASSSQKLLKIVSQILHMDKTSQFREYALKNNFFITILERLRILTGLFKRKFDKDYKQELQEDKSSPTKPQVEDDGTKKIKKKKGVGYGNDSSSNTKWMKGDNMQERKKQFETVRTILGIIENFLDVQSSWKIPDLLLENIYESALLPFVEDGLRAGTLLQISKHPEKFKAIFNIIRVLTRHEQLIPVLLPIDTHYQPKQIESIESLLKSLENIASIFLSCLTQSKTTQTAQQKMSAQLATLIKETYKSVEQAIEEYKENHMNDDTQQKQLEEVLQLPLDKKYRLLMKDLRFDYIDMKQTPNKIKHHYSSSFNPNYTPNQNKMIRLAQELADISTALPHQHTNAIYVRCDKDRVDFMQALIMGSNGTPYGHGAFLFDVYFDDNYPNNPPKVNLTTTGHGKVRFNPNLYACGKVCLSLLGTWRGSASENWDAKVSTLLQVLLSIQAIIMSEQIYFNEPGFENQQGTQEGEKKNEAYSNIVRYSNIKFAMIENIRNPPKGFETVIRRHFYLKKDEIMQECRKWQKYAQKRPANYVGLVNDHNHSWSSEFKKSKTQYKQMLDQAIKELQEQLNKLPAPKITDIITTKQAKKQTKKKVTINKIQQLQKQQSQQQTIDVSYDKSLMSTESKQIDITDEKVKDRWSRYIGAMGIDAVSKQSKADILVFGLNPLALQVVKNLVLSGCRRLTICDEKLVTMEDLSGGFFYTLEDVGKKRVQSILYKIRQLNAYVKIDTIPSLEYLTQVSLKTYSLILATQLPLSQQLKISTICREQNIKFISADCIGFTGRIVNDLGKKFEVLDKNGQEPVEVFIKDITIGQKGIVTLLDGVKNPFEDGQAVLIRNVQGMKLKEGEIQKSINDTLHKVKVINSKSFEIGNTLNYTPYIRNGTVKNIKTPVEITFKPFSQIVLDHKNISVDENLAFYDFAKLQNSKLVKSCYLALQEYRKKNELRHPQPWNVKDMTVFLDIFKGIHEENVDEKALKFVEKFALTARGYLPPLCAFFGGLVCQQIIKAITQKYKPINSEFYIQFSEIVPELPQQLNENSLKEIFSFNKNSRDIGLEIVVGNQLVEVIRNSKLFMIGSGAIGCELLKNFAMIGFGTGEKGKITLTDPDHIENSNLNRQFLFREKHISKSKSRTASEAVKIMNPGLKNHITALTERVSDSTKDIFTNKFFEGLTLVANALDNVAARRYVDQRCVQNKIPLFQSGTLGPKGHVQVIIPYLTESYGSQNDPVQEGEIPHCTLKMFPEETLHCVQWARDIFGKKFSLQPKALLKIIDKTYKPQKDDIKSLSQCVTMVKKCPKTFEDCINYAIHKFYKYYRDDVMQLLYTYPLDAKTKNGEPFWKLPKRPPTPIKQFDPENILQCTFVASLAVMVAKIYQVDYPKNFRSQAERLFIGKQASKVKIPQFVPSDEKAKEILKQSTEKKEQNAEEQKMEEVMQEKDENQLYKEIITTGGHQFKIKVEQFEKDDDSNGHIDFIYSMANLRAINYKLDQMDWINVKIKAGRIVPALATTTACVSGLQTLQICKYLKKIKIDLMKNSYLNLAVPSIQMSQPGQVLKKKITEKLTVNLWDRWEVVCEKSSTFGDLYEKLLKKYEIFPVGVLQGMSRIDTGKSEQAKKQFMKQKILDKLDLQDNYIDIIVLFTKNQQDDKIIEGVPPVRLIFN